jgi:hypothetical protein
MTDIQKGLIEFKKLYDIEYNSLIKIPKVRNGGIYKENYKILYDKTHSRYFTIWSSPYKNYIYIENEGFIIQDEYISDSYKKYVSQNII